MKRTDQESKRHRSHVDRAALPDPAAIRLARLLLEDVSDVPPIPAIAIALTREPWHLGYADACLLVGAALRAATDAPERTSEHGD